ncbi:hypothetical protein F4861DRAFT_495199 [Xylaria intraflava]|nr:hypothetical protein F4861DRAFT_495199 [Xylaria intraflava]
MTPIASLCVCLHATKLLTLVMASSCFSRYSIHGVKHAQLSSTSSDHGTILRLDWSGSRMLFEELVRLSLQINSC